MSLGDPYCTLAQLKAYMYSANPQQQAVTTDDALLTACIATASRKVEKYCQRQFNLADTETARLYRPTEDPQLCQVDDFVLTSAFQVLCDPAGVGSFQVVFTAEDYELHPLNNIVNGIYQPYNEIRAVLGLWFWRPILRRQGTVQVTARWGWQAVPDEVYQATLQIAYQMYKMKDAPFGTAGSGQFGELRVRDNPIACALLAPFMIDPLLIG
jgi:hypothetical protein